MSKKATPEKAPKGLTPKQEAFARVYLETSNASEAYRQAYDVREGTKPQNIWVNACKLLANAKVAQRVAELHQMAAERSMVTVASITRELDEARDLASSERQAAAMTGAIMGKAKLHGLLVDRQDHNHRSADGTMTPSTIVLRAAGNDNSNS